MNIFSRKSFFVVKNIIYMLSVIVACTGIYYLINETVLFLEIESQIPYLDIVTHICDFRDYSEAVTPYITKSLLMAMWVVLILLVLAGIMFFKDMDKAIILQLVAIGTSTATGVLYFFLNMKLGLLKIVDTSWKLPVFIILLVLGTVVTITGIVLLVKEEKLSLKSNFTKMCVLGIMVGFVVMCLYPYIMIKKELGKEYDEILYYLEFVDSKKEDYDEEIGYQIGNYCKEDALYVEGKLYIRGVENDSYASIYTIDDVGNYELFWKCDERAVNISAMYYYDSYIYVAIYLLDDEELPYRFIRISMVDGEEELLLSESSEILDALYGISGNRLYYYIYSRDKVENKKVYYINLDGEISKENAVLYDDGVDYSGFSYFDNKWVCGYIYNQRETRTARNMQTYQGNAYWLYYDYYGKEYFEILDKKNNDHNVLIDTDVEQYNIFDGQIYYIKKSDECYEIWRCDLAGENKTVIGTVSPKNMTYNNTIENEKCIDLYLADGYMVIDFNDGNGTVDERYIKWLDDGSVKEIK